MWIPGKATLSKALREARASLVKLDIAAELVKDLEIPKNSTVIELNSGYGCFTYALLQCPNVKRVIAVENNKDALIYLQKLKCESDNRLQILEVKKVLNQNDWISDIQVESHPWEEGQYLKDFHRRSGIQKFGRVRMNLITPSFAAEKLSASTGDSKRSKLSFMREAVSELEILRLIPEDAFQPKGIHVLYSMIPMAESKISKEVPLETFEFILSHMVLKKNAPIRDMLYKLGAGAENININLTFDSRKAVVDATVDHLVELAYHFEKWPFRPPDFDMNSIDPDFKHRKRA
ncbi:2421_t:CDS:2 [Diversispora eburnea]|uniref:rRNA adenine N(6)-methyltransferase n=1 Tax=Diversispora eburnea TaxID=1213867 RepID=A0A9N9BNX6_9GLOM|nr:2421_t:CDS:2 [Diversispora eburnea]